MKKLFVFLFCSVFPFLLFAQSETADANPESGIISYSILEEFPRFPGCEDLQAPPEDKKRCADEQLLNNIYRNIHYPLKALRKGITGTCVVNFTVEKDGSLSDFKVVRDVDGAFGKEVIRMLKLIKKTYGPWIPGKQKGQPVRVSYNVPVHFNLK